MSWREVTPMVQRRELIALAQQRATTFRELCRRFNISTKTGYKWLERSEEEGSEELADRSRRPLHSPNRSSAELEAKILKLRDADPTWGGRKLRRRLMSEGLGDVPSASTITEILRRHGRLDPTLAGKPAAFIRFEHPAPNILWQMDFKGHFGLLDVRGSRCHPLTLLDDHSRFVLCLRALPDERGEGVYKALEDVFQRYGLPNRITADNGGPWANIQSEEGISALEAKLIRLGIDVSHSRPYHPQTQGKLERFHRTLKLELLDRVGFASLAAAQLAFDIWREKYNYVRPHEACADGTPASRYHVSPRAFPDKLPAIEYDPGDIVRRVGDTGRLSFRGTTYRVGKGLAGYPVALRPTPLDGFLDVFFCHRVVAHIDLRQDSPA